MGKIRSLAHEKSDLSGQEKARADTGQTFNKYFQTGQMNECGTNYSQRTEEAKPGWQSCPRPNANSTVHANQRQKLLLSEMVLWK